MTTDTDTQPTNENPQPLQVIPQQNFSVLAANGDACGFLIQPNGEVILAKDQTIDQYKQGLKFFQTLQHRQKEWFSSYVSKGRKKFGLQIIDLALQQLEFDMPIVQQALDIATIPQELRHDGLNSEHYLILARAKELSPAKRAKWAKTASDMKMSPSQLKSSIKEGEVVDPETARHLQSGVLSVHGLSMEFSIWVRRVQDIDPGVLSMEVAAQDDILRELEPIAKFYEELKAKRGTKPTKKLEKRKDDTEPKPAKKKPAKKAKAKKAKKSKK